MFYFFYFVKGILFNLHAQINNKLFRLMNCKSIKKQNAFKLFFLIFLFITSFHVFGEEKIADSAKKEEPKKEKFNAGHMIMEHIADAHEWHVMEIGEKAISIPLPIILYSNGELSIFCSSRFHHGTEAYNGFKLEREGKNKGKIVVANADGTTNETAPLPLDLSITKNVLSLLISLFLICFIFISIARRYTKNPNSAPKGLQSIIEPIILFVRDDIARPSMGEKKYKKFMPFLLTVFFFIFFNNLLGLIPFFPGGANVTGNIAVTMVLAVFTFVITCVIANKAYWLHVINAPGVPWWLKIPIPLMPVVEIMGVFTKPFVLMVRLFANITAGHIIILGFISLIFIFGNMNVGLGYGFSVLSVAFAIFMGLLELLVAFLQAYVFTLLSAIYFGMATEEHHAEHKH